MKKFSVLLLSVLLLFCGIIFSACKEERIPNIVLSSNHETIYLGETENNQVKVNVKLENISVSKLEIVYDTSTIEVIQEQEKLADGSFVITVKSKVNVGTKTNEITISALGKVSASLFVDIVLPLTNINSKDNLYVAYNGTETSVNLRNFITFSPEGTKQTDVDFTLAQEYDFARIEGEKLYLADNISLDDLDSVMVNVQSKVEGKTDKGAILNIKIVPNPELLAQQIKVVANYNGNANTNIADVDSFKLSINKEEDNNMVSYLLSTFEISITIPKKLGIGVDVYNNELSILNYLTYESILTTNNENNVHTFKFNAKSALQGEGKLSFKYSYQDYVNDKSLTSVFVCGQDENLIKEVDVSVKMLAKEIKIETTAKQNPGEQYIIYKNYKNVLGTGFTFVALPEGTIQNKIKIYKPDENIKLFTKDGEIVFEDGVFVVSSHEQIFVQGLDTAVDDKTYEIKYEIADNEKIGGVLYLVVVKGTSKLGFVSSVNDNALETIKENLTINLAVGGESYSGFIYALGAKLDDLIIFDKNDQKVTGTDERIKIVANKQTNYFSYTITGVEVGVESFTIKTENNYSITLTVNTIQPLENAVVMIKDQPQFVSGIGNYKIEQYTNELLNISIINGYSVELDLRTNENAVITRVDYSFYEPNENGKKLTVYDDLSNYKNVEDSAYGEDFNFVKLSSVLDSRALLQNNVLSTVQTGFNVIKIDIYGQNVISGELVVDIVQVKYIFVEVYNPVKVIQSNVNKNIELRAYNDVYGEEYKPGTNQTEKNDASVTINIRAMFDFNTPATYNRILLRSGTYNDDTNIMVRTAGQYICELNVVTGELKITALKYTNDTLSCIIFADDFLTDFNNTKPSHTAKEYELRITILQTKHIEDISIKNLDKNYELCTNEKDVYKTLYINTLNNPNPKFKLFTEVTPFDAYNTKLSYSFIADSGSTEVVLEISEDGIITVLSTYGGTGVIRIKAVDVKSTAKTIEIPIVVTDGNSWQTAYEITSLEEITRVNKHYVLTIPTTYILEKTLFKNAEFAGGLYGRRFGTNDSMAAIRLEGVSLFKKLSQTATVADLYLCGDVTAQNEYTARGFVANENAGTITNIKITSFIDNGIYVPSLIKIGSDVTKVGGIAGTSTGTISNCEFAGTIDISNNSSTIIHPIANGGTIDNCVLIIAKYENLSTLNNRTIVSDSNRINGVIGGAFDSSYTGVEIKSYENNNVDLSTIEINNLDHLGYSKVYTNDDNKNGYAILFRFEAKDSTKQKLLDNEKLNIISITNLLNNANSSLLRIRAVNVDGSPCDFISTNADNIQINGIGSFLLKISSVYDYTVEKNLNMLSLNYADNFAIKYNGVNLSADANLELVYGYNYEIETSLNNNISVNGQRIELKENILSVIFELENINANKYITGTFVGYHTINMSNWTWTDKTEVKVKLKTEFADTFNILLNNYLFGEDKNTSFNVQRKTGTVDISTNLSEGSFEPADSFNFDVTISTDKKDDFVDENTIKIFNEYGIDVTKQGYFDITSQNIFSEDFNDSSKIYKNKTYNITIRVSDTHKNNPLVIGKIFNFKIHSAFKNANDVSLYDISKQCEISVLAQSLASIESVIHTVTSTTINGVNVSYNEKPTSVLVPNYSSGVITINLYPYYASFDYFDLVATTQSLEKLSFRLQTKNDDYTNTKFFSDSKTGYDSVPNANGIRIYNNYNQFGEYYIKVFAGSVYMQNAVFTLTVTPYFNGQPLQTKVIQTLYMQLPVAPQLSLNGETSIYSVAGKDIKGIECLVDNEQLEPTVEIVALDDKLTKDADKSIIKYTVQQTNSNLPGFKKYIINLSFADNYISKLKDYSTKFKVVVTSVKIVNGVQVPIKSELFVFIVDYLPKQNDIKINGATANDLVINSLFDTKISMSDLSNLDALNIFKNTTDQLTSFADNYYYNNSNTNFVFGSNRFKLDANSGLSVELPSKAYVLASYISYVNGNSRTPILKYNNLTEKFEFVNTNIVEFKIDSSGNLVALGTSTTGTINMVLEIPYTMPDGRKFVYEHLFTISNHTYTTLDDPEEIESIEQLLEIQNNNFEQDYILTRDLVLNDFVTIASTKNIRTLDGNNHTIHIESFANDVNAKDFALFGSVLESTTIKNLTVNLYHLSEIQANLNSEIRVAGFAIENSGSIYNCEVVTYKNENLISSSSIYGLKLSRDVTAEVAGFVLTNNGTITNSRVGGTTKLSTNPKFINGEIFINESVYNLQPISIIASGTISGFVGINNGVVASSFVKGITIKNTYEKQETKVTSGFIGENNGTITMSYVEGIFANDKDIRARLGGIQTAGIASGFVYYNSSKITDCYSNINVVNTQQQSGRLGAGFVYYNAENADIERCYSASAIEINKITHTNFVGLKDFGGYNNDGILKYTYYYVESKDYAINIEQTFNSSVEYVIDPSIATSFYGFSFSSGDTKGAWYIDETRKTPSITSANDITHSTRVKIENNNSSTLDNEREFTFVYCEGYELGTIYNPITIRNAQEYNLVFSGKGATAHAQALKGGKAFGTYRIINNIDLLELVPEEEKEQNYKVNLASTNVVLSGQESKSTYRNGSLDGNGLTIKNLAISNSMINAENFGMFRALEGGATICNLNIELAQGGVGADQTVYVGTIAGTLRDSNAYNIAVKSQDTTNYTTVVGRNIVGGVFGRVIGNSSISYINVENVSATSTYNRENTDNIYVKTQSVEKSQTQSIAGGVVGVLDFYKDINDTQTKSYVEDVMNSAMSISVMGSVKIEAMTAGGVFGFVGREVSGKDLSFTVSEQGLPAKILAYKNGYAGGIVGVNYGFLKQVKSEHEADWQKEIESNMYAYYQLAIDEMATFDRGSLNIFQSSISADIPNAVGGLVGFMADGKLSVGYSKLNVIVNAKSAGGIIGQLYKETSTTDEKIILSELYSTGDVYSNFSGAKYAGIIGKLESNITANKINALNYWGYDAYKNGSLNAFFGDGTAEIINAGMVESVKFTADPVTTNTTNLGTVNANSVDKNTSNDTLKNNFASYASYTDIATDNGAKTNKVFSGNDWYSGQNWKKDLSALFPSIQYRHTSSIYEIHTTEDFHLFIIHGRETDAQFVVFENASGGNDKLIDCKDWKFTLGSVLGRIYGATNEAGFKNLSVPLFNELNGSHFSGLPQVSSLKFKNCKAITNIANDTSFDNIAFENCNFNYSYDSSVGGVTNVVKGKCVFSNIQFDADSLLNAGSANNAGFLFGKQDGDGDIEISNIKIDGALEANPNSGTNNYGKLFGVASGAVTVSGNVSVNNNIKVTASGEISNIYAGVLAGHAGTMTVAIGNDTITGENGLIFNANDKTVTKAYIGGIVGYATNLKLTSKQSTTNGSGTSTQNTTTVNFAPKINTKKTSNLSNLWLGTIAGQSTELNIGENLIVIAGQKLDQNNLIFEKFNISPALKPTSTTGAINNLGGIVGQAKTIGGTGAIGYTGDIEIGDVDAENNTIYLNVGGIAGTMDNGGTISSAFFDGTIGFGNAFYDNNDNLDEDNAVGKYDDLFLRLGGIVGYNNQNASITINNVVASGEILLTKTKLENSQTKEYSVTLNTNMNIAGVVGFNAGTLTLGESGNNIMILTTIFAKGSSNNVDAVVRNNGTINGAKIVYSSMLTLNVTALEGENITIENVTYGNLGVEENTNLVWKTLKTNTGPVGSKLNPASLQDAQNFVKSNESNKFVKIEDANNNRVTYQSTYMRKLYIGIDNSLVNLNKQISLKNAVLFAKEDGGSIKSTFTPFHNISADSAVSGVIARIYIDETNSLSKNYENYAGFVNINNGTIYTCAVQELFADSEDNTLQFYAYMNISKNNTNKIYGENNNINAVAGFVAYNTGKIFGCNTNIFMETEKNISLNGFVTLNDGTIEYSYASGVISNRFNKQVDSVKNSLFTNFKIEEGITIQYSNDAFKNCYSIVKALDGDFITRMPSTVYTEQDAIENNANFDNLESIYQNNEKFTGYYAYDKYHNWFYPTLSAGPFENFTFLKRITMLKNIADEDGDKPNYQLATEKELQNEDIDKSSYFMQVPNVTVFKNMTLSGNKNFIIISNLNVGYTGEIATSIINELGDDTTKYIIDGYYKHIYGKNKNGTTLTLKDGAGLINTIKSNVTIKNIKFSSLKFSNGSVALIKENNGTIQDFSLEMLYDDNIDVSFDTNNIKENAKLGCLVSINNGTIANCTSSASVTTTGKSSRSFFLGGIVGANNNNGTVENCEFGGSIIVKEQKLGVGLNAVYVGGVIGFNSGTATKLELSGAPNKNYVMIDDQLYEQTEESLSKKTEKTKQFTVQIYVLTNKVAYAGGLVGYQDGGTISKSFTNKATVKGSYIVLVGDEYNQISSYAGGIVGYMQGGSVQDVSNRGNVGAMARWQFTTNEESKAKYKIDDNKIVETENGQKIEDLVYYDDEPTDPYVIFDKEKYIYTYREMTSLAYAGGITSCGIKEVQNFTPTEIAGNYRLVNYGNVMGGFRDIKPISRISSLQKFDFAAMWEALAYGYLAPVSMFAAVKLAAVINPPMSDLPIALGGFIAVLIGYKNTVLNVYRQMFNINVKLEYYNGNSCYYYKNNELKMLQLCYNNSNSTFNDIISDVINSCLFKDGYNHSRINFKENEMLLNNINLISDIKKLHDEDYINYLKFLSAGKNDDIDGLKTGLTSIYNYNYDINYKYTIAQLTAILGPLNGLFGIDFSVTPIEVEDPSMFVEISEDLLLIDDEVMDVITDIPDIHQYYYDTICSTYVDTEQKVYSKTNSTNNGKYISVNENNCKLPLNANLSEKHGNLNDDALVNLTRDYNWSKDRNTYIPSEPAKSYTVSNVKSNDTLYLDEQDEKLHFILTDSNNWERIVQTINDNEIENIKDVIIEINLEGNKTINVKTNVINEFNGEIINKNRSEFNNITLVNNNENCNYGLIQKTNGCKLENLIVKGLVSSAMENEANSSSLGVLIGENKGETQIYNIKFQQLNLNVSSQILETIDNIGLVVGVNNSDLNITSVNITANDLYLTQEQTTLSKKQFGGIVGSTKGALTVTNIEIYGKITMYGDICYSGGIIGKIESGETTIDNVDINLSMISDSYFNNYVGGIAGYLDSKLKIENVIKLATNSPIVISADVLEEDKTAYAGGILGGVGDNYNLINNANYEFGNASFKDYNNISYIYAGMKYTNTEMVKFAKNANASLFVGNNNEIKYDHSKYSIITRYKYIERDTVNDECKYTRPQSASEIIYSSMEETTDKNKNNTNPGYEITSNFKSGEFRNVVLNTDNDTKDIESYGYVKELGEYAANGSFTPKPEWTKFYKDGEELALSVHGDKRYYEYKKVSLGYEIIPHTIVAKSSSVLSQEIYSWDIIVKYGIYHEQYKETIIEQEVEYRYNLKIYAEDLRINDTSKYRIEFTQMNDFEQESKIFCNIQQKIATDSFNITNNNGESTGESIQINETTNIELFKVEYKSVENFEPKLLFSETIELNDNTEKEYTIEDWFNGILTGTNNKHNTDNTNPISVGDIQYSIKSLKIKIDENRKTDVTIVNKLEVSTIYNDSYSGAEKYIKYVKFREDGKNVEGIDYSGNGEDGYVNPILPASGNITKEFITSIIEQQLYLSNIQKETISPNGTTPATPSVSATVNNGPVTIDNNDSMKYTENITLGGVDVEYKAPTYSIQGKQYSNFVLTKLTAQSSNYLLVSCGNDFGEIDEYIYMLNESGKFTYCGYISYKYSFGKEENISGLLSILQTCERYDSFFPNFDPNNSKLSAFADNTIKNGQNDIAEVLIDYYYTNAKVAFTIESGNMYYTAQVTYETYKQIYTVDTSFVCTLENSSDAPIIDENKIETILVTGTNDDAGGLLTIESKTAEVTTEKPLGFESSSGDNPSEYYVYNGKVVGYNIKSVDKDGTEVITYKIVYNNENIKSYFLSGNSFTIYVITSIGGNITYQNGQQQNGN